MNIKEIESKHIISLLTISDMLGNTFLVSTDTSFDIFIILFVVLMQQTLIFYSEVRKGVTIGNT